MANPEEMYQCQTVNCGYFYNPDKGDRKGKIEKAHLLKIFRPIGNALFAEPVKRCLNRLRGPAPQRRADLAHTIAATLRMLLLFNNDHLQNS